jgi:peroxiredoxin
LSLHPQGVILLDSSSEMECSERTKRSRLQGFRRREKGGGAADREARPLRARLFWAGILIGVFLLVSLAAGLTLKILDRAKRPGRAPGQTVSDFAIKDVRTGQVHRLSDHSGRIVAIVFTGTACPVSERYIPRVNALARKYENRGVDFLAINSNASESDAAVARHARLSDVEIPVLKDPDNRVADLVLAESTCEALLIDRSGTLCYRGAIDDERASGSRRGAPEHNYLDRAIEAVIEGKPVSPELTPVAGSPIERINARLNATER